ncbi:hypothetical protein ENBRE01_2506 [Enteropsectra breve]|nr:hypothetical protein ENBRE01_2506 [Enteropsectra breve]
MKTAFLTLLGICISGKGFKHRNESEIKPKHGGNDVFHELRSAKSNGHKKNRKRKQPQNSKLNKLQNLFNSENMEAHDKDDSDSETQKLQEALAQVLKKSKSTGEDVEEESKEEDEEEKKKREVMKSLADTDLTYDELNFVFGYLNGTRCKELKKKK